MMDHGEIVGFKRNQFPVGWPGVSVDFKLVFGNPRQDRNLIPANHWKEGKEIPVLSGISGIGLKEK